MNTLSSLLKFIATTIGADPSTLKTPTKNLVGGLNEAAPPVGAMQMFAGSTAPSYWLICDGSAVSRTDYADLFAVIGTTYGTGDGSTTFNLPNMQGRTPIGVSSGHALGTKGGEETHTLSVAEMPNHGHIYSDISVLIWGGAQNNSVTFNSNNGWHYNTPLSGAVGNTGGGGAHNNMQPFTTVNFIIYAGV